MDVGSSAALLFSIIINLLLAVSLYRNQAEHLPPNAASITDGAEGLVLTGSYLSGTHGCKVNLRPKLTKYMSQRTAKGNRAANLIKSRYWTIVTKFGAGALTALDVGAHDPFVLSSLTWVPTKVAIDIQFQGLQRAAWAGSRGVVFVHGDIFETNFMFDGVISDLYQGTCEMRDGSAPLQKGDDDSALPY